MTIDSMLASHPHGPGNAPAFARCVQANFDCAATCSSCADACLGEADTAPLRRCINLNLSCAEICEATGRTLLRFSSMDIAVKQQLLAVCEAVCRACAAECAMHGSQLRHCEICAETCRNCAAICGELGATGMSHATSTA